MTHKKLFFSLLTLLFFLKCSNSSGRKPVDEKCSTLNNKAMSIYSEYQFHDVAGAFSHFEDALNLLDSAIYYDSDCYVAYNNKITILSKIDRFNEAIDVLTLLIKKVENNANAFLLRGSYYEKLGRIDDANESYLLSEQAFDKLIKNEPKNIAYKADRIFLILLVEGKEIAKKRILKLEEKHSHNPNIIITKGLINSFDKEQYLKDL